MTTLFLQLECMLTVIAQWADKCSGTEWICMMMAWTQFCWLKLWVDALRHKEVYAQLLPCPLTRHCERTTHANTYQPSSLDTYACFTVTMIADRHVYDGEFLQRLTHNVGTKAEHL